MTCLGRASRAERRSFRRQGPSIARLPPGSISLGQDASECTNQSYEAKPEYRSAELQRGAHAANAMAHADASEFNRPTPVGREVSPADGLTKKAAAGEKNRRIRT